MNSNIIRTLAAVLTALVGVAMSLGNCVSNAVGATVCSAEWLTPTTAGYLVAGLGLAHVILKVISGGMAGLTKPTVPVTKTGAPGTVTQQQVDTGSLR